MPALPVMPTKVGIQWSAKRDPFPSCPRRWVSRGEMKKPRALLCACILLISQIGLVARGGCNYCASIMPFWVPAFAGMTERELCVDGYLQSECEHISCWHALRGAGLRVSLSRGGGLRPYPALRRFNRSAIGNMQRDVHMQNL